MYRASNTFSVLQAIAATAALAIVLWSIGIPSLRLAEAANVTSFSDTLSTSQPSVGADHTIEYVATNGVDNGETIVLTFDADGQNFGLTGVAEADVDMYEDGALETFSGNWTVTVNDTADTITITSTGGTIAAGATTTIEIGTHATADGSPATQIVNPTTPGSYTINVESGETPIDTGETQVAIVNTVEVTASVDTVFTFNVNGVASGETVSGTTTGTTTTATEIGFGELTAGTPITGAQGLQVITNAKNGFVVTVQANQQLSSTNGADIDSFVDGGDQESPIAWTGPTPSIGNDDTYGHWGLTSDDTDIFTSGQYVAASTTAPVSVFDYTGPVDGTTQTQGSTTVGYTVQISSLQEAANDYTATLTYVATPVF